MKILFYWTTARPEVYPNCLDKARLLSVRLDLINRKYRIDKFLIDVQLTGCHELFIFHPVRKTRRNGSRRKIRYLPNYIVDPIRNVFISSTSDKHL